MRKKAFEKLLKAAIILEAEEQGAKLSASEEPIPAEAQARFDAALNGAQKQERAELAETKKPEKRRLNWLSYGIAAVSVAALVLVVALMIGLRTKTRAPAESGAKDAEVKTEHEHSDLVPAPGGTSAPAPEEIHEPATEPINLIAELKEFFSENQTLLEHASEGNTLRLNYLHIVDGQALYQMPKSDPYSIANPKWFSTDVQALIEISAEGRFSFYWDAPSYFRHESNQPFVQGAKPCFGVKASENGDEEQSKHEAWLIYTENIQEQFAEPYRGKIQPLAENWYLYVVDLEPEPELWPEPEPLPSTNVTFASEAEAEQAMKQFYEDNTVLLNALAQEMKSFYRIQDGYLYEKASYYSSWRPVNETPSGEKKTEAIEAFLALPDAEDYDVWWRDTEPRMFVISCRWYNDDGYYSTALQYAEGDDVDTLRAELSEAGGFLLEPVTAEGAWGISTSCWRKVTEKGSLNYVAGKERRISTKEMIEADDGFSGVGTVRGNTNGNLRNGGRALSDGTYIYYIDQTVAHLRLCRYTLATGEIKTLWDLKEVDRRDAGWLNLAPDGSLIYAEQGTDHAEVKISHYGALHYLCKFPRINALYVVYDCIVIDVGGKTVICDMDGETLNEIEGFSLYGIMGGILYGRKADADGIYAYNMYGRLLKQVPVSSDTDVYAANGYLIAVELDPADETTVLTLLNVSTGTSETYRTGLYNASVENFSKDGIYLKEYGYLSVGPIWRMSWYGTGPECVDSRFYELGPTLWNDSFLNDFVPCDETAGETVEMPEGEPVLKVMVNEGNPRVYRREDTAIDREIELRWEADKCILRYQPNHVAEGPLQYKAVPIGQEVVVRFTYFDAWSNYRFWLAPEDAPLPDEWNAIIAENKRIEDAQATFASEDAFFDSRDEEAERQLILSVIPEYEVDIDQNVHDWQIQLTESLWDNGDVTVHFVDAKRIEEENAYTIVLTGDNGKTYELYIYRGWLQMISCGGKMIHFYP